MIRINLLAVERERARKRVVPAFRVSVATLARYHGMLCIPIPEGGPLCNQARLTASLGCVSASICRRSSLLLMV